MANCRNCGHTEKMCKCGGGRISKLSPRPPGPPQAPRRIGEMLEEMERRRKGTPDYIRYTNSSRKPTKEPREFPFPKMTPGNRSMKDFQPHFGRIGKSMQKGSSIPGSLQNMINNMLGVGKFKSVSPAAVAAALMNTNRGGSSGMKDYPAPGTMRASASRAVAEGPRRSQTLMNVLMNAKPMRDPENPNFVEFKKPQMPKRAAPAYVENVIRDILTPDRSKSGGNTTKAMSKSIMRRPPPPPRERIIHPPPPRGGRSSKLRDLMMQMVPSFENAAAAAGRNLSYLGIPYKVKNPVVEDSTFGLPFPSITTSGALIPGTAASQFGYGGYTGSGPTRGSAAMKSMSKSIMRRPPPPPRERIIHPPPPRGGRSRKPTLFEDAVAYLSQTSRMPFNMRGGIPGGVKDLVMEEKSFMGMPYVSSRTSGSSMLYPRLGTGGYTGSGPTSGSAAMKSMSKAQSYPPPPRPNPNVHVYPDQDHYFGGALKPGRNPRGPLPDDRYPPQSRQMIEEFRNARRPKPRRTFEELQYRPKTQYSGGAGVGTRKSLQKGAVTDTLKTIVNSVENWANDKSKPTSFAATLQGAVNGAVESMGRAANNPKVKAVVSLLNDISRNSMHSGSPIKMLQSAKSIASPENVKLIGSIIRAAGAPFNVKEMVFGDPAGAYKDLARNVIDRGKKEFGRAKDFANTMTKSHHVQSRMSKSISSMNQNGTRHVVGGYRGSKMSKAMAASQTQTKNKYT